KDHKKHKQNTKGPRNSFLNPCFLCLLCSVLCLLCSVPFPLGKAVFMGECYRNRRQGQSETSFPGGKKSRSPFCPTVGSLRLHYARRSFDTPAPARAKAPASARRGSSPAVAGSPFPRDFERSVLVEARCGGIVVADGFVAGCCEPASVLFSR